MKKRCIYIISAVLVCASICTACSSPFKNDLGVSNANAEPTPEPIYSLMPSDVLTSANLQKIISYSPVVETIKNEADNKEVLYRSEPIGSYDTVTVKVEQYTNSKPKEKVKEMYTSSKAMRSSSEDIDLGSGCEGIEAYIAYPSVHLYYSGYYVTITAGSGSDDAQKQLLITAAKDAALNLKQLITDTDDTSLSEVSTNSENGNADKKSSDNKSENKAEKGLKIVSGEKKAEEETKE